MGRQRTAVAETVDVDRINRFLQPQPAPDGPDGPGKPPTRIGVAPAEPDASEPQLPPWRQRLQVVLAAVLVAAALVDLLDLLPQP